MKSEYIQIPKAPDENMIEAAAAHLPELNPSQARRALRAIYQTFIDMRPNSNYPLDLTVKMTQTLDVIMEFQEEHGYAPTQVEIAKMMGVDRTTIRNRINSLRKKGYIAVSHKHRSMKIIKLY